MIRIAHAVVPIVVPSSHELSVAQPITFASMRAAAANARQANVSLCGITFTDEADCMPDGFTALPSLTRSIGDVRTFRQQKKLALLRDILDRLTAVGAITVSTRMWILHCSLIFMTASQISLPRDMTHL